MDVRTTHELFNRVQKSMLMFIDSPPGVRLCLVEGEKSKGHKEIKA